MFIHPCAELTVCPSSSAHTFRDSSGSSVCQCQCYPLWSPPGLHRQGLVPLQEITHRDRTPLRTPTTTQRRCSSHSSSRVHTKMPPAHSVSDAANDFDHDTRATSADVAVVLHTGQKHRTKLMKEGGLQQQLACRHQALVCANVLLHLPARCPPTCRVFMLCTCYLPTCGVTPVIRM